MALAALASGALAVALGGCDMFKPATPEPPSQATLTPDYGTVAATLNTLKLAIEFKGQAGAASAYLGAFADAGVDGQGFEALFDPLTLSRFSSSGGFTGTWDLGLESHFYDVFVRFDPGDYQMEWTVDASAGNDVVDEIAGTATLHRHYVIRAISTGGSSQTIVRGFADLDLIHSTGDRWVITKWHDREDSAANHDEGEHCYGERRLELR